MLCNNTMVSFFRPVVNLPLQQAKIYRLPKAGNLYISHNRQTANPSAPLGESQMCIAPCPVREGSFVAQVRCLPVPSCTWPPRQWLCGLVAWR